MSKTSRQVWIGLVEVRPVPGNDIFDGAPGAFSNALCLARDEDDYRRLVEEEYGKLYLEVIGIQDLEPLEQRRGDERDEYDVPDEVLTLASHLSVSSPFVYDTFEVYESEWEEGDEPAESSRPDAE